MPLNQDNSFQDSINRNYSTSSADRRKLDTYLCSCGQCNKVSDNVKQCLSSNCNNKLVNNCTFFKCSSCMASFNKLKVN
jgi:hypothetical protein